MHKKLQKFGWAHNPHFTMEMDLNELESFVQTITPNQLKSADKDVGKRLHRLLYRCAFQPHFRAYQIVRASELPFLNDFSHHLEAAHTHYYRGDYFSAVLTFVPAIEGIMRSHAAETIQGIMTAKASHENGLRKGGEPIVYDASDASISDLLGAIAARSIPDATSNEHDHSRTLLTRDFLFDMLNHWIFCPIEEAERRGNFAITLLNRNGIQHAFRPDCYYTQADVGRLFLVMDIYIELIRHELGVPTSCFLPNVGANSRVDRRREYFIGLMLGRRNNTDPLSAIGRELISEHPRYRHLEDFDPLSALVDDMAERSARLAELMRGVRK